MKFILIILLLPLIALGAEFDIPYNQKRADGTNAPMVLVPIANGLVITNPSKAFSVVPQAPAAVGLANVTNDLQTKASVMPNTLPGNGQIPIGNGASYTIGSITAGANISITPGVGTLIISATGVGTGDALVADPLSQFASTTSAELDGVISDNNGTGKLLFADGTIIISTGDTLVVPAGGGTLGSSAFTSTSAFVPAAQITGGGTIATGGFTLTVGGATVISGTHSGTSSGTNTGDQTSVTGNAGTATALQTPRNINGEAFDGTADITVLPNVTNDTQTKAAIMPNTVPTTGQIPVGNGSAYVPQSVSGHATISSAGVITLATIGTITPGAYTNTNITVDAFGRITAIANGSGGTGDVVGPGASTVNSLAKWNNNTGTLLADGPLMSLGVGSAADSGKVPVFGGSGTLSAASFGARNSTNTIVGSYGFQSMGWSNASGSLTLQYDNPSGANIQTFQNATGTIALTSNVPIKAWVRYDAATSISTAFTYTRTSPSTTMTITQTGHGYRTGQVAYLDFTSGGYATDNSHVVTVIDANNFTIVSVGTTTVSGGGNTLKITILSSSGVDSVVYTTSAGQALVNFTSDFADLNYDGVGQCFSTAAAVGHLFVDWQGNKTVTFCPVWTYNEPVTVGTYFNRSFVQFIR